MAALECSAAVAISSRDSAETHRQTHETFQDIRCVRLPAVVPLSVWCRTLGVLVVRGVLREAVQVILEQQFVAGYPLHRLQHVVLQRQVPAALLPLPDTTTGMRQDRPRSWSHLVLEPTWISWMMVLNGADLSIQMFTSSMARSKFFTYSPYILRKGASFCRMSPIRELESLQVEPEPVRNLSAHPFTFMQMIQFVPSSNFSVTS